MNFYRKSLLVFLLAIGIGCNPRAKTDDTLVPVPFNKVHMEDTFWSPRLQTHYQTLLPYALDKTKPAVENLRRAANYVKGVPDTVPVPPHFITSDLFKVMEGASYILAKRDDPKLEKQMDTIINVIAQAQKEDGYLYVPHIADVAERQPNWGNDAPIGDKPYSMVNRSHELYNMGHMYEAAIAYYQATGKDQWLNIAKKNAKHINKVFFEGDPDYNNGKPVKQAPGHQEIELALMKLYRVTDNKLYLNMAEKFLDIRGETFKPDGKRISSAKYAQQHAPVEEQKKAVGHAVRATYMYTAMAEVGALTDEKKYDNALNHIWHNIVDTKMYIIGGLGVNRGMEGFGPKYVLPNKNAYNETCAAVGNVFFNYRMFLNKKNAKYLDVAEVALYNNALAGVNLEGNRFFYSNPMVSAGKAGRSPWFGTACCPSNTARIIPQVPGMMYARTSDEIYATFYGSNSTTISLENGDVEITQKGNYPFGGDILFTITPAKEQAFAFKLRIPTWAQSEQFVPGELYNYKNTSDGSWKIKVNGEPISPELNKGFATIERVWQKGDQVQLRLPMKTRFNTAIDSIKSDQNKLAVTRGPLVYSTEGTDNEVEAQQLYIDTIPDQSNIKAQRFDQGKLEGIMKIQMPAKKIVDGRSSKTTLTLIPYYSWNNRGKGSMVVWFPNNKKFALK